MRAGRYNPGIPLFAGVFCRGPHQTAHVTLVLVGRGFATDALDHRRGSDGRARGHDDAIRRVGDQGTGRSGVSIDVCDGRHGCTEDRLPDLIPDLDHLRTFGAQGNGVVRPSLSEVDMASRHWLASRMREAGIEARIDGVGNVIGRSPNPGPALAIGQITVDKLALRLA